MLKSFILLNVALFCCIFLIFNSVYSMEKPEKILLGHEDKNAYPWVFPVENGYEGLDIELLKIMSEEIGVTIEFVAYPWIRCLEEMRRGNVDGVFASSFRQERMAMGRYPMNDDKLDTKRMIHTSGYSLYIRKGSDVSFDGQNFYNLNGELGVQRAFSIIPELNKFNIPLDDGTADPIAILLKLMTNRIDAAAIQTARGDNVLETNKRLRESITTFETNKPPFEPKPYFVMFSHQFYDKYPDFAEKFWDMLPEVIASDKFNKAVSEFYSD